MFRLEYVGVVAGLVCNRARGVRDGDMGEQATPVAPVAKIEDPGRRWPLRNPIAIRGCGIGGEDVSGRSVGTLILS
jgi:hypothetical protein